MFTFNDLSLLPTIYPFREEPKDKAIPLHLVSTTQLASYFVSTYGNTYIKRSEDAYYIFRDTCGYWVEIPKYRRSNLETLIHEFLATHYINHLRSQFKTILRGRKETKETKILFAKTENSRFVTLVKEAAHLVVNHIDIEDVPTTDFQPKAQNIHLLSPTTNLAYVVTVDSTQENKISKRLAQPEDHVLKDTCIPLDYDPQDPPEAPTRTNKEVFTKYFPRENELEYVLTNIFGMSMHGNCKYKQPIMFAFTGVGSNGKSTILNILSKTLSPLADNTINADLIMQKKYGNSNYAIGAYQLRNGCRIAIPASDITSSKQYVWNQDQIKMVTRMEPITGSDKYVAATRFTPQATIMFSCNALPTLEGQDMALLTRLEVIEMSVIFKDTPNPNLVSELIEQERLQLFHFFLTHMLRYQELFNSRTLQPSPFEASKQEYISSQEGMQVDARVATYIKFYTEQLSYMDNQFTTTTQLAEQINKLFHPLTQSYTTPIDQDPDSFATWKKLTPRVLGKHLKKLNLNHRTKPADPKRGTTNPTKMYPMRYLTDKEILQRLHLHFMQRELLTISEIDEILANGPKQQYTFDDFFDKDAIEEITSKGPRSYSEDNIHEESIYDEHVRDILYADFKRRFILYVSPNNPEFAEDLLV